ncbi:MAG: ISAs1 family transposase [Actinomycetota bacterium]
MVATSTRTQSSAPAPRLPAGSRVISPLPLPPPSGNLPALYPFLAAVADPRKARGKRHPLPAVLGLVCLAMLSGIQGYLPAAEWGAELEVAELRSLGFNRDQCPAASTLFEVLQAVSWEALEAQLRRWAAAVAAALPPEPAGYRKKVRRGGRKVTRSAAPAPVPDPDGIAIDGKTLRGSWKRGAEIAHMLSVVTHGLGLTLAQAPGARKSGELTALRPLLKQLVLDGLVVTMDAQFTQADIAATIRERGGDYVMRVKENQPNLLAGITELLSETQWEPGRRQSVCTFDLGHGRLEERQLVAQPLRPGEVDWPGAAQIFVVVSRRTTYVAGQPRLSGVTDALAEAGLIYGITSLAAALAPPDRLLRLFRGHWAVENCCFWVRDVVMREDASPIKQANIVAVMASLRGAILTLLRARQAKRPAQQIRKLNASRKKALTALGCL